MSLCFFIGCRKAPESIRPVLAQEVSRHIIEYGVRDFIVGRYGNFDRMVWQVLANAKQAHPELGLNLRLAVAYPSEVEKISAPWGFDGVYFPEELRGVPGRKAIPRLNQHLVQQATHLIAYVDDRSVNSRKVAALGEERARQGELVMTMLAEHPHPLGG